jgi:uncharacterized protein
MDKTAVLEKTREYVKSMFAEDSSGHDWWHIKRVYDMSLYLAEKEQADSFICGMAALLHEVPDWKFNTEKGSDGHGKVVRFLENMHLASLQIKHIAEITCTVSFKGAGVEIPMTSPEGKIVQDADRLDAIGAIGIARAFTFGGSRNSALHDPDIQPVLHTSFEEYKLRRSTTINHFYEKLLLLKDRMNTMEGKKIAENRHQFLQLFLDKFLAEWQGER